MKPTVSLWNVPLKVAEIAAGALRSEIAMMCMDNYPAETIKDACYYLNEWEKEIADAKRQIAELEAAKEDNKE